MVSGNYQSVISVIDLTDPANAREIAYADPAPLVDHNTRPGVITRLIIFIVVLTGSAIVFSLFRERPCTRAMRGIRGRRIAMIFQ